MKILQFSFWKAALPGLAAAVVLAVVASRVGRHISWLGPAGFGILAGAAIASLVPIPARLRPGLSAAGKQILQLAVILLGAGLNLAAVWRTGVNTLALMLVTISAVFIAAAVIGRALRIPRNNRDLVAAGTAICGGSAIAAIAPVIGADEEEIGHSISVVFLFNLAAVVLFPILGHALGLDPHTFGVWAGTAVNDTSSVLATALAYDDASVPVATLVKMTRTVMIVPMAVIFAVVVARRARTEGGGGASFSLARTFPWFVLGFLLLSVLTTWGGLPPEWASGLNGAGKFLIVVALSGIGLNTNLGKILRTGTRPVVLGACLWLVVMVLALVMIRA
ncbi:MAG: putative sulfate exporter family transporter [Planctomycetaceae bacterium]|nr:putative sulfate exporter family transporter [Planctomycetaceae bacterium]